MSPPPPVASPAHRDLLGDDDEPATTSSPPLQDKSAEIGNIQNQLHSTNRALETASNERADLEKKLAEQAAQLSALQSQLSSAKAAYETESRLLTTLRERYSTQNSDIQKSRSELIRAESELSGVRVEKSEVEGSLLRDKEEVRELQRKMTEVGSEVEMVKAEIEKAKKEAKQQKGLLAIAKKQLATRESERAKAQKELEEAQAEAAAAAKEREEAEAEAAKAAEPLAPVPIAPERALSPGTENAVALAASQPLPGSPDSTALSPASPTLSTKSTNPFERLTAAAGSTPSQSPFLPFGAPATIEPMATGGSSSIPAPAAISSDPFGFDEVFGGDSQEKATPVPKADSLVEEAEPASATTTESSQAETSPFGISEPSASINEEDIISPSDTEHFVTPPSTATIPQGPNLRAEEEPESGSTEAAAEPKATTSPSVKESYFPDLSEISGKAAAAAPTEDTDLTHSLKELEVDESDSDSDSDDEPLDYVKAKLQTDSEPAPSTSQAAPAAPSFGSAFDDSFGISSAATGSSAIAAPAVVTSPAPAQVPTSPPAPPSLETPKASAIVTEPSKSSETPQTTPDTAAGVSDFDEALGKLSGSSQFSHVSQFTFDSAFEDDFDFAAAKAATSTSPAANGPPSALSTAQPPSTATASGFDAVFLPPTSPPVTLPAPVPPSALAPPPSATSPPSGYSPAAFPPLPSQAAAAPAQSRPFSFDDVFGTSGNAPAPQAAAAPVAPSNGPVSISFDDAFGSDHLALDSSFASTISNSSVPGGPAPPTKTSNTPFPSNAGAEPSSPVRATSPSTISHRSQSPPPRAASPPGRLTSPRPRPSTSSSEKEKSTRHSKLSVSDSSVGQPRDELTSVS